MESISKHYIVKNIGEETLKVTGEGDSELWQQAHVLNDFQSPWDAQKIKEISFRALCNEENFFFCFRVEDSEVYIDTTDNTKGSINNSDRVELFFRSDNKMDPYYCLEIDPTPRIMDFKARPNKMFDFNWNWPLGNIEVKSSIEKHHFVVEGVISLSSLTEFGLLKDGKIETGIYRAKYNLQKNGSYEPTWITWVDPGTEMPNFHIPSSFGLLELT